MTQHTTPNTHSGRLQFLVAARLTISAAQYRLTPVGHGALSVLRMAQIGRTVASTGMPMTQRSAVGPHVLYAAPQSDAVASTGSPLPGTLVGLPVLQAPFDSGAERAAVLMCRLRDVADVPNPPVQKALQELDSVAHDVVLCGDYDPVLRAGVYAETCMLLTMYSTSPEEFAARFTPRIPAPTAPLP